MSDISILDLQNLRHLIGGSYYVPAAKATREEIDHVKNILTQPSMK